MFVNGAAPVRCSIDKFHGDECCVMDLFLLAQHSFAGYIKANAIIAVLAWYRVCN